MPPEIKEWIDKAEADWATAQREFRVRRRTNFDAVCFHSQQLAEKTGSHLIMRVGNVMVLHRPKSVVPEADAIEP